MSTPQFISRIDWQLLRSQKLSLLNIIPCFDGIQPDQQKKWAEHLEGILNLIDAVQDFAAENGIASPHDVYLQEILQ